MQGHGLKGLSFAFQISLISVFPAFFFSLSMSNVKVCLFPLEMGKISSGQLSEPIAVTACLWNSVIHYLETNVTDSLVQSLCSQTFCWHPEKLHLLQRWSAEEALHAEYLSHTAEQLVIEIGNLDSLFFPPFASDPCVTCHHAHFVPFAMPLPDLLESTQLFKWELVNPTWIWWQMHIYSKSLALDDSSVLMSTQISCFLQNWLQDLLSITACSIFITWYSTG